MTTTHNNQAKLQLIKDTGFDRHFEAKSWPEYNKQFFDGLAEKYDATNELHSLGTKSKFDRKAVARMPVDPGSHLLDLCTGSGDIAIELAKQYKDLRITGVDASPNMLSVARRKSHEFDDRITYELGDALALEYPENYFDCAVISFGLRNLENLESGLAELKRVVKPGGFVCNIDQGKPTNSLFNLIYNIQFKHVAPVLGKLVFHRGEYNSFKYLPESNKYFPDQSTLCRIFEEIGYRNVTNYNYWFGAVAQQIGIVPPKEDDEG